MQPAALPGRPGSVVLVWALALAGCEPAPPTAPAPEIVAPAPAVVEIPSVVVRAPALTAKGDLLGAFRFTMYYVAQEADQPALSGEPDVLSGAPDIEPLFSSKDCVNPIATVTKAFAKTLDIQGTGKLRDGRVVNTSGACKCSHSPCYAEIQNAWAMGPKGGLSPFRSVAVDTRLVKLGTMLYIPELDGKRMPGRAPWGGYIHDGCVVAEDRGGGIRNHEIDFFVAKKAYSNALDYRHRLQHVTVYAGNGWCEMRNGKVRRAPAS